MTETKTKAPTPEAERSSRFEPFLVGVAAFIFYALTGARGVQWGDPAKLMLYVHDHVFVFSQEEHIGHILWSLPFSLLPIQPFSWRMHLSSAMTLGAAMGMVQATLLRLGFSRAAGRAAVTAVAVAHTIWFTGTIFETYPLVLLIIATAAWLLITGRSSLVAGALLGFGVTVHPITLFGMPGIAFGIWRSRRGMRGVFQLGAGVALGGLLVLLLLLLIRPSGANLGAINWASASVRYGGLDYIPKNVILLIGYLGFNFFGPALVLLAIGAWRLEGNARLTALLFALPHYLVAAFWLPQRSYLIPIPVYFASAYVLAIGAERILRSRRWLRYALVPSLVAAPVLAYAVAPILFTRFGLERTVRDAPYRTEATYFMQPWKFNERSANDYMEDLARTVPPGSALVGDWVLHTTLLYAQRVEHWREDFLLINADVSNCELMEQERVAGRPIYVLDNEPGYLPECLLRMGFLRPVPGVESLTELVPGTGPER